MAKRTLYTEVNDALESLEKLREHDGTELGESWERLFAVYACHDYFTEPFQKAIAQEILDQANWVAENMELIATKHKIPAKTITTYQLRNK